MPYQNRVTPFGEFEAVSARGLFMGNRGILHDVHGVLGPARWRHRNWIVCVLAFKGRKARINAPAHYTQLFFLDEATAFAAGHRPCAECRRPDYQRYLQAWQRAHELQGLPKADEVDQALHRARVNSDRRQVRSHGRSGDLPDGTIIALPDRPGRAWLIWQDRLHRWTHDGYTESKPRIPELEVAVLTPQPTLGTLKAGYVPEVHASASRFRK